MVCGPVMVEFLVGVFFTLAIVAITVDDVSTKGRFALMLDTGDKLNVDLIPLANTPVWTIPVSEE